MENSLTKYFKEFLQLLFADIHDKIDWTKGHSFLDKELQQITADAKVGRRYADQLIKVYAKDGSEEWNLIQLLADLYSMEYTCLIEAEVNYGRN